MTTPALQLRLPYVPPPGICRVEHCGNRLSVANTDGICDQCHACPLPVERPPCARCKAAERRQGDVYCHACRNAISLASYHKKNGGPPVKPTQHPQDRPCYACGRGVRIKDSSYCRPCYTARNEAAYLRRKAERQAARGQGVGA